MQNYKIYKPREDSKLLEKYVRKYSKSIVLDIGTGSGIQAITAAKSKKVKKVIATDIQKSIIEPFKKKIKNKKIKFIVSDLFKNIKNKKFDTIIFNPPYLPSELKVKDLTLEGGKKGYEVIEKFLNDVNTYLKPDGLILIIFSSLTKKDKVDEFIKNNLLESKLLEKQHYFFEDLYVYLIKKSALLKTLEKKNIKNINYFTKGKRGFIFIGNYKNKKIAIKIKNPESEAILRINNEIKFLKILNKKNIGPKLLLSNKGYLIYEFVDGNYIVDYLKDNGKERIKRALKNIFEQLFIIDKLKINKEEMSHPPKHVIIDKKNKPILIDFERCHKTEKPSNTTQFCSFLVSNYVRTILKSNKIKINKDNIIHAAKIYKKQQDKNNLNNIIDNIK
jgi:release factor glutamine methyltransferase